MLALNSGLRDGFSRGTSELVAIPGLDGERRQDLAAGLWRAWWEEGRGAAVLTGFSGLGKTDKVVRPLASRAIGNGRPAVLVDVPPNPMDLDKQLTALLVEELSLAGATVLAEAVGRQPSFSLALRELLRHGALVVLDEFQRLLQPSIARPAEPLATNLHRIATRPQDKGCLWLVSSRHVDPTWTEPFHTALLEPPSDLNDLERIVLTNVEIADAEQRFSRDRRLEVVRRLGANPRALRLLGNLLQLYPLEELLGPAGDVPDAPVDPRFTEQIEGILLTKAEEGLSNAAGALLRELTILREPAQWELVEAIGGHFGDVRAISRELRERYLLEPRPNRYHLHPIVREVDGPRLRRDEGAWRAAHRSAGTWYARLLSAANRTRIDDAKLAIHLAEARYHLIEAQVPDELREAMRGVQNYIEQNYGWSARRPTNDAERDMQISLLDLYLTEPGAPGVEFQFAKLLKERAAPGDLSKALPHAQRSTAGLDVADPWLMWIRLVSEVQGLEAAVTAARTATEHVAPAKGLYSVYQLLGAFLCRLGRPGEAVGSLLEGAERADGSEARLIEEALYFSAAEASTQMLQRVLDWMKTRAGFGHQSVLGEVLLHEHRAEWRRAAEIAQSGRALYPTYLPLANQEALCWLGGGEPEKAQSALDRFSQHRTYELSVGNTWLTALVALRRGDLSNASQLLSAYLRARAPTTEAGIRAALLRDWDRAGGAGSQTAARNFPILPPTVGGLETNVRRPLYGPPMLPQHQSQPHQLKAQQDGGLRVLAIGDEWHSSHGGLSTFNRQLCGALASIGADVVCLVLHASSEDRQDAAGVTLVEATRAPGQAERDALSRKPRLPDGFAPDVIIGHGRVTGPAAQILADDHFPMAKRLHFVHMAPDEIEWFKLDRDDDAGARAEERTKIELELGRTATRVVAVGPRLHNRYLTELYPYDVPRPLRLDPGFDASGVVPRGHPPPGSPWRVMLLGRLEDDYPKGLDLAAKAVGLAAKHRGEQAAPLELVLRGARPDTSADLRGKLREWSGHPALGVVVRPFTTDTESLDADIRRASLVLMPSRKEGFGLVGLEAIVAGTPVLVSSESGLGGILRETLEKEQADRIVVPMSGDDERDGDEWGRAVERMLSDREASFHRATEVRALLAEKKTWAAAIGGLLAELRKPWATS
jgi:glycosyltransferase involved in cell wall biosynthesis